MNEGADETREDVCVCQLANDGSRKKKKDDGAKVSKRDSCEEERDEDGMAERMEEEYR